MSQRGQIRIGIAGWRYDEWRGTFYPESDERRELEFASRQLNSIELNGTFYSTQRPNSFQQWSKDTPDDFVFSIKGSQFITHVRRIENVEVALANFLAQGLLRFGKSSGQFSGNFRQISPSICRVSRTSSSFCREHKTGGSLRAATR